MKRALLLLAVAATGCPPPGSNTGTTGVTGPQPVEAEVGCPAGQDVYVASYLSAEPGKGHTGWVLPVRDDKADTVKGLAEFEDGSAVPPQTAPQLPLWILQPGTAPCRVTLGKPYRAAIDVASAPNLSYGVELDGCAAPTDPDEDEAVVVASAQAPGQCQIVTPHPVAARLGEIDQQRRWTPPVKQVGIPKQVYGLVPPHACTAPTCEMLWSFMQVDVGVGPVAWSGAVNWMQTSASPAPVDQVCKWPIETYSGFFVPGPNGTAVKVETGQEHPLVLTAVLADHGGAKVLLADGAGEYSTYDLSPTGATLARHLVWLLAEPTAYGVDDRVGPVCDAQPGAPGPAGAAGAAPVGAGASPLTAPPPLPKSRPAAPPLQPLSEPAHP